MGAYMEPSRAFLDDVLSKRPIGHAGAIRWGEGVATTEGVVLE